MLEPFRGMSLEAYGADVYRRKAVERLLQEVVEAAVDINSHLIVGSGRPAPDDLHSSFLALAEVGVIDRDFAAALAPSDCKDLYFVSRNDGTHVFCPDLRCHQEAVREWQVEFFRARRAARESAATSQ